MKYIDEIEKKRIVNLGENEKRYMKGIKWMEKEGRKDGRERIKELKVKNIMYVRSEVKRGVGIEVMKEYMEDKE